MQREIKFEYGFESVNGIVKKVYSLSEIPNIQQKCDVWNVLPIKYVRQYIGIKDAAGVDVFEGDVIKGERDDKHVIEWEEKEARFVAVCGSIRCGVLQEWVTGYNKKVIGNIYENPELLK